MPAHKPGSAAGSRVSRMLPPALLFAALAVAWFVAARDLWQTSVPGDLHLPELDPRDYFSSAELRKASDYERFLRIDVVLSQLVLLGVLALYARGGARFARESAAGRIGTGMLFGMLGLAFVWISQLPFGVAGLWWERRHGISKEGYFSWVVDSWFALGGEFLFICLAILVVMSLAALLRDRWWMVGGPAFAAIAVIVAFVQPYLIPDLHGLRNPRLAREAEQLERAQRLKDVEVKVQDVHEQTTAPNAEATGLGPNRRVILWDTLLDGRFPRKEVRQVLAHEFAHLSRDHIPKSLLWYALFAVPATFLIALATRRQGSLYEPRAVPLFLFLLVALQVLTAPLQNVVSRRLESEADWVALETTRDPRSTRALHRRLAKTSLAQPRPPTWAYVMLDTHPTTLQRIAMAEAWKARRTGEKRR